jgi:hypothetical protein
VWELLEVFIKGVEIIKTIGRLWCERECKNKLTVQTKQADEKAVLGTAC